MTTDYRLSTAQRCDAITSRGDATRLEQVCRHSVLKSPFDSDGALALVGNGRYRAKIPKSHRYSGTLVVSLTNKEQGRAAFLVGSQMPTPLSGIYGRPGFGLPIELVKIQRKVSIPKVFLCGLGLMDRYGENVVRLPRDWLDSAYKATQTPIRPPIEGGAHLDGKVARMESQRYVRGQSIRLGEDPILRS